MPSESRIAETSNLSVGAMDLQATHTPAPGDKSDTCGRHEQEGRRFRRRLGKSGVGNQGMSGAGWMDAVPEKVTTAGHARRRRERCW